MKKQFVLPVFMAALLAVLVFSSYRRADNNTMYGRIRVSKETSLVLSTTPQKLIFNGVDPAGVNTNTFSPDPMGSGNQLVSWDGTNNIFKFYNTSDINYTVLFSCNVTCTLLTTTAYLRIRLTIPNGLGAGTDYHLPDPGHSGYADMGPVNLLSATAFNIVLPFYVNPAVRTNGMYMEAYLSNSSLGTIILTNAQFLIQSSAPTN